MEKFRVMPCGIQNLTCLGLSTQLGRLCFPDSWKEAGSPGSTDPWMAERHFFILKNVLDDSGLDPRHMWISYALLAFSAAILSYNLALKRMKYLQCRLLNLFLTPTVIRLQPGVAVSNSFKIALESPMGPAKEDLGNSASDMKQRQQKS